MDGAKLKDIEALIHGLREEHNIPGCCLGIVSLQELTEPISCGFGFSNLKDKIPVTRSTKMCIGSITKCFTSGLLAQQLQHQKKLNWDTPLRDIFGEDFQFLDDFRTERASLRDVLAHKMGIELGETDFGWLCGGVKREKIIRNLRALPVSADFRTRMIYNNFMYTVAGLVSEKLGDGTKWEAIVQENIFNLLGMSESGFIHMSDDNISELATPYMQVKDGLVPIPKEIHRNCDSIAPAGSIYSSANDMVKWMTLLLNKGKIIFGSDEVEIINHRFLEECWKPQFALPRGKHEWDGYIHMPQYPASETRDTYGFGWYMGTYRGHRYAAHGGELFGYDSLITLYHDAGFGVYTCFNGPAGEPAFVGNQLIHYYVSDIMLGLKPWLDPATARSFPEPWGNKSRFFIPRIHIPIQKNLPSTKPIGEYCGQFVHDFMGEIIVNIDIESNTLIMQYGTGRFLLHPTVNPDEFRLEGVGIMNFLHQLDLYAPSEWMMIKFRCFNDRIESLLCSLFESSPLFLKLVEGNSLEL